MNKFYTQTFYGYDGEMHVDRMVIVCGTPEEAADKAIDKLARKHYIEELEGVQVKMKLEFVHRHGIRISPRQSLGSGNRSVFGIERDIHGVRDTTLTKRLLRERGLSCV